LRGAKRPGLEINNSPPSDAEVKKERSNTSTPLYTWTGKTLFFTVFVITPGLTAYSVEWYDNP
jgi:hypothetical protein